MKFALIWSREVESHALAILGPSLTRKKNAKGRAFPICYRVYVITNASSRRGIIAMVVEYARRRPIQGGPLCCVPFGWSAFLRLVLLLWERISERAMLAVERYCGCRLEGRKVKSVCSGLERIWCKRVIRKLALFS